MSMCGDVVPIGTIGVIIAVVFALRKKWRSAAIVILSLGSTVFFVTLMKDVFVRIRPENALQALSDYSFPSGHSAIAAAFFMIVAYLVVSKMHSWVWRELVIVGCVVATIVVGLSRLALNVHWASDVIAGWSLGIFLATGSILLVRYVAGIILRNVEQ